MNSSPNKGGGLPFRSVLNPHVNLIVTMRAAGSSWQGIASALHDFGVSITAKGVLLFIKRLIRRQQTNRHLLGCGQPAAVKAQRPTPASSLSEAGEPKAAATLTAKPFSHEVQTHPTTEPKVMFRLNNDIVK